jgi:hypothetical protein
MRLYASGMDNPTNNLPWTISSLGPVLKFKGGCGSDHIQRAINIFYEKLPKKRGGVQQGQTGGLIAT